MAKAAPQYATTQGAQRTFAATMNLASVLRRITKTISPASVLDRLRNTRVILAAAHLDHDPANSAPSNLKTLCQRCHMLHDHSYHRTQRWLTYRMRWAIGDLFLGPYAHG